VLCIERKTTNDALERVVGRYPEGIQEFSPGSRQRIRGWQRNVTTPSRVPAFGRDAGGRGPYGLTRSGGALRDPRLVS